PPSNWPSGEHFTVDPIVASGSAIAPTPPPLRLVVLCGSSARSSYTFSKLVVRIGRSDAPLDRRGRPRYNDVAFIDNHDETHKTVTRGHCHVRYDKRTGRYRVFDEGSANGTRIVRSGEIVDVRSRDPQGVALIHGDELHAGRAVLRINLDE